MMEYGSILLVALIPLLLNVVTTHMSNILAFLHTSIMCFGYETRKITHSVVLAKGMRAQILEQDARNDIFIKCILMHLTREEHCFKHSDVSLITCDPRLNPGNWKDNLEISSFTIANKPLPKQQLQIRDNIWLITDQLTYEKTDRSVITTTYLFTSPNASTIDKFLEDAYRNYVQLLSSQKDTRRYYFSLDIHSNEPVFKRYVLDSSNTFDTLFFREKKEFIELVDSFQSKTGKYAIPGTPQKLGFLLSGLPGTGKTSIIKALATYTNRHIVNISLGNIATNKLLHNIMYDCKFNIGEELPLQMTFEDILFIFEDIDVSSNVCHSRELQLDEEKMEEVQIDNTTVKRPVADSLNLAGLLNALDGVIDSPNRIVVMTTNNPDVLDEALVRPGRVDYKLCMSYMAEECVFDMLAHYFPSKSLPTTPPKELTPASVQQIICQHDYEDAIALLF